MFKRFLQLNEPEQIKVIRAADRIQADHAHLSYVGCLIWAMDERW